MRMDAIVEFVKAYLLPGSVLFLMIGLTAGVLALFGSEQARRWARRWLAALAVGYWALSTPLVAGGLEALLSREYGSIEAPSEAEGVQAIVVLGGGGSTYRARGLELDVVSRSSALRALEGARLYRLLGEPLVFASGGSADERGSEEPESGALAMALVEAGVPTSRIVLESNSRDTHEQALELAPLLAEQGVQRFVLVTSPTHMRRALAAFRGAGLEPIPSVSAQRSEAEPAPALGIIPNPGSLQASTAVLREVLALAYYGVRGWLGG